MTTQRNCPRDGSGLTRVADVLGPGKAALTCPTCSGVSVDWADAEPLFKSLGLALTQVHELVAQSEQQKRKTGSAQCTSCNAGQMKALKVKGVELDLCENCGHLWFDRGELARVTQGKLGATLPAAPVAQAGTSSRVEGVFEMLWDCGYCGTEKLLGASNRCCPQCGAAQDATKRYFPKEGEEIAANHAFDGADRTCPACGTPNGAKANNCRQCGSPLDGSAAVNTVADRSTGAPKNAGPAGAVAKKRALWPILVGLAALMLCGFCGVAALWTKDVAVEVTGHRWQRSIDIEVFEGVHDSAWCDAMPSAAYNVSRSKEQRGSNQIPDGETCTTRDVDRGNGTFERRKECKPKFRSEPIYDTKCSYTIDRWHQGRTVSAKGTDADALVWPALSLRKTGQCLGCEKEGAHHETYTLDLKGAKGESFDCDVPLGKWQALTTGSKHTVKVGVIAGGAHCDSL